MSHHRDSHVGADPAGPAFRITQDAPRRSEGEARGYYTDSECKPTAAAPDATAGAAATPEPETEVQYWKRVWDLA
eukprot:11713368-Heterocapsa_arctica.AAC.1